MSVKNKTSLVLAENDDPLQYQKTFGRTSMIEKNGRASEFHFDGF